MKPNYIYIHVAYIFLGLILFVLTCMNVLDDIYSGFGGGLLAVGILQLIRDVRMVTNKEYHEKVETEIRDERNRYIQMKAWSWTGYISVISLALVTIVFMILSKYTYMQITGSLVAAITFVYWVCNLIIRKRY